MQRSIKALKSKTRKEAPVTQAKVPSQTLLVNPRSKNNVWLSAKNSDPRNQKQPFNPNLAVKSIPKHSKVLPLPSTRISKWLPRISLLKVISVGLWMLTVDALQEEVNVDRPIPSIDLSASTAEELYSLESIVSESELNMIDAEGIYSLPDEASRIAAMPHKSPLHGFVG
jgi:A49-like RNA polymerase I associated factor